MSGRRVLLVGPDENRPRGSEMYPSSALLTLGTLLYHQGHDVSIVHLVADHVSYETLGCLVSSFQPDVVGITVNTFQLKSAKRIASVVRTNWEQAMIVAGGPHVTCLKEEIFRDFENLDAIVIGEGEESFPRLVNEMNADGIAGVVRRGKTFEGDIPRNTDLDALPFSRLELVNIHAYTGCQPNPRLPSMFVLGSRGCPFDCVFCSKAVRGRTVRFRQPESVVEEVLWLRKNHAIEEVYFVDDIFNINLERAEAVFKGLIAKQLHRDMEFKVVFRANKAIVSRSLLELARKAGVRTVFFGVESGSQEILDRSNKNLTIAEIERAFALAHEVGLQTIASFIIGLPGENERTVRQSIELWSRIKPTHAGVAFATPFPDTQLQRILLRQGNLLCRDYEKYSFVDCLIQTDELSAHELVVHRNKMLRLFEGQ